MELFAGSDVGAVRGWTEMGKLLLAYRHQESSSLMLKRLPIIVQASVRALCTVTTRLYSLGIDCGIIHAGWLSVVVAVGESDP